MPHGLSGALERPSAPFVQHATSSRIVKGEDVLLIKEIGKIECQPPAMLYMVCDGHSGVDAASFVMNNFLRLLTPRLPSKMPHFSKVAELEAFAEHLRKALCETFVRLDSEWSRTGHLAGTTVTAVLSTGWLLTVANTGDSSAIIDTGSAIVELTRSHRIHTNKEEQARLRSAGCYLASLGFHLQGPAKPKEQGVGPLRIWPGGLCVSRSIGDADAGKEIVPVPHIRQLLMPVEGGRVIMSSDGLWDVLTFYKAAKLARPNPAPGAVAVLMAAVSRDQRVMDDTSIVIVEVLPSSASNFPTVALRVSAAAEKDSGGGAKPKAGAGGFFACFRPEVEEAVEEAGSGGVGVSKLAILSDTDCLKAYPGLKMMLANNGEKMVAAQKVDPSARNYSTHGGNLFLGTMDADEEQETVINRTFSFPVLKPLVSPELIDEAVVPAKLRSTTLPISKID